MDEFVVDLTHPELLDDESLRRAVVVLAAEQQRRAVESADFGALVELGFKSRFRSDGMPADPLVVSSMLVCAGAKIDKSAMSHRCAFVRIGSDWVWESDLKAEDVIRYVPGRQQQMRSVSLVPVMEGLAVDLVEARTRNGVHELVGVRSFVVEGGELTLVSARLVDRVSHR